MITSCFEECGNEDWPKIHSTWQVKESDLMTSYDFFTCFVLHPAVRRLPRSLDISVANYESEANWKLGSWKARKWAILQFDLSYIRIYFWHHIRGNIRARTETTTDVLWLAKYKLVTKGHHAGKGNAWGTRCDTSISSSRCGTTEEKWKNTCPYYTMFVRTSVSWESFSFGTSFS